MTQPVETPASMLRGGAGTGRGIVFMLVAGTCGVIANAVIRQLSADLHPFEIAFFRTIFGLVVLAPLLVRNPLGLLRTRRLGLHGVRGSLQSIGMMLMFSALSLSPLAKVTALSFSGPLFATLLACLYLGEVIRARRISALAVGFAGTLVILRPGMDVLDLGAVLALLAASEFAVSIIIMKILVRTESSLTMTLYSGVFAVPLTGIAAYTVWRTPDLEQLAWLLALGALATLSNVCMAQALREADISTLMPVRFTRLIFAALVGYLVFAEVPDVWTWLGGTMIFSATLYIAYRERRMKSAAEGAHG